MELSYEKRFVTGDRLIQIRPLDPASHEAAVRDNYRDALEAIVTPGLLTFHIVVVPEGDFCRTVLSASDNEELSEALSDAARREVSDLDCIVLLGRKFLDAEIEFDEMMEIAALDVAEYLTVLWPAVDPKAGWLARHLSWTSIAGVIVSGVPQMKGIAMGSDDEDIVERVCGRALSTMIHEKYSGPNGAALFCQENEAAIMAVDNIASECRRRRGLIFPALPESIAAVSRDVVETALRQLKRPLVAVI